MENNMLLKEEQALGSDQVLKVTALLYFKEALVAQEYESCQELVGIAKELGIDPGDISGVIADYLSAKGPVPYGGNINNPGRQGKSRLRPYKEE